MSRTIMTVSGNDFDTNISAEQLLGLLCKKVGVKYASYGNDDIIPPSLAYSMTKEETLKASEGLISLIDKVDELWPEVKHFFSKNSTEKNLINFLEEYAKVLKESDGFECIC